MNVAARTIYLIVNNFITYGGGVERVTKQIVDGLPSDMKQRVVILCNDHNLAVRFEYAGIRCINFQGNKHPILDRLILFSQLCFSYKVYSYLKKNINDGDVVWFQGIEYSFFTSLLRSRLNKHIKMLVTVHGLMYFSYSEYVVERLPLCYLPVRVFFFMFRGYYRVIDYISLKGVDQCTFITKLIQKKCQKMYNYNKPSRVIYNGIEPVKKKNTQPYDQRIWQAVIVGSTPLCKGLDVAIRSIKLARKKGINIELTIIGFGGYKPSLDSDKEGIRYLGRIPPVDMQKHYAKVQFLMLPSRHEGFPLTVLEAIQNGLPFIVSDVCRTEEIPNYDKMGIIVAGNSPKEYTKAIEFMIADGNYQDFKKNINHECVSLQKMFSWKEIVKQYENVLKEI